MGLNNWICKHVSSGMDILSILQLHYYAECLVYEYGVLCHVQCMMR